MTTTIKKAGQEFAEYVNYVFKSVLESLSKSELTDVQVLAIFLQLSSATNKEELKNIIENLIAKYPSLKEVNFKEQVSNKEKFDFIVQTIVSALIKEGKSKEAEQFVARSKEVNGSTDSLRAEFTEYFSLYI